MAESSLFEKNFDPLVQAGIALAGVLVIDLIAVAVGAGPRFTWLTATSFMLFFAVFNAVFSVSSRSMLKYWGRSIYAYMGLAAGAGLLAWLFSGLTIYEAGSFMWIYIVVTIGYLVFLTMVTLMRKVVEFAQREEWNRPKIRQKKRKY
ncbi:MAG: hypothetical protein AAFU67_08495 [Bacteroidota bacterium]